MSRYATFVVRIQVSDESHIVGGQVSHVGSQKVLYFRDLAKLMDFIERHLTDAVEQPESQMTNGSTVLSEGDLDNAGRG